MPGASQRLPCFTNSLVTGINLHRQRTASHNGVWPSAIQRHVLWARWSSQLRRQDSSDLNPGAKRSVPGARSWLRRRRRIRYYKYSPFQDRLPIAKRLLPFHPLLHPETESQFEDGTRIRHLVQHKSFSTKVDGASSRGRQMRDVRSRRGRPANRTVRGNHAPAVEEPRAVDDEKQELPLDHRLSKRRRLVQAGELRDDLLDWLPKLREAAQSATEEEVKAVWSEMKVARVSFSSASPYTAEVWRALVHCAPKDDAFLLDLISYTERGEQVKGHLPRFVYPIFMMQKLESDPELVVKWHKRLKSNFPPSARAYKQIFNKCLELDLPLDIFAEIYCDAPVPKLYANVMRSLCVSERYEDAFNWHFKILATGDKPQYDKLHCSEAVMPLLKHFRRLKDEASLAKMVVSILAHEMLPREELKSFIPQDSSQSRNNAGLGYSDLFCAKLFANSMFGVSSVINGLKVLNVTSIGPHTLREIVSKDSCDGAAICGHLDQLRMQDIEIKDCKYSNAIRHAAIKNQTWLLRSIITSEPHPDTYDDLNFQETLYAKYLDENDQVQADRTLAVITHDVPRKTLQMQQLNFMLRANITLRRNKETMALIEKMRAAGVPVTPKSSRHFRYHLVEQREGLLDETPEETLKSTELAIKIMQYTVDTAGPDVFPIDAWREILRRLGSNGLLKQCQRLAIWLVIKYAPVPGLKVTDNVPNPIYGHTQYERDLLNPVFQDNLGLERAQALLLHQSVSAPPETLPPLQRLFSPALQKEIVAWGFISYANRPHNLPNPLSLYRGPGWAWGLLLLRRAQRRGLPIKHDIVAKAALRELHNMFHFLSPFTEAVKRACRRRAQRHINRRKRIVRALSQPSGMFQREEVRRQAREEIYHRFVQEVYRIWGRNHFRYKPGKLRPVGKSEMSHPSLIHQARDLESRLLTRNDFKISTRTGKVRIRMMPCRGRSWSGAASI